MIKLKFDEQSDKIEIYRDKNIITALDPQDFGALIREVKRIMEEASPAIAKKQERKRERKNLIMQLKMLVTVKLITFLRRVRNYWKIINQ